MRQELLHGDKRVDKRENKRAKEEAEGDLATCSRCRPRHRRDRSHQRPHTSTLPGTRRCACPTSRPRVTALAACARALAYDAGLQTLDGCGGCVAKHRLTPDVRPVLCHAMHAMQGATQCSATSESRGGAKFFRCAKERTAECTERSTSRGCAKELAVRSCIVAL